MGSQAGIFLCYSCGNKTPHAEFARYSSKQLYDQFGDDELMEPYEWQVITCGTCEALSLRGGFVGRGDNEAKSASTLQRLFPVGPHIAPPPHSVSPSDPIPSTVVVAYEAAWPLRFINPGAFANQIRRCLEFICRDQEAKGANLASQLRDLAKKGILPADLARVADLLRDVGNIASHAGERTIDRWDAELVDELFKTMVRYIYVAPAQVRRMQERLKV